MVKLKCIFCLFLLSFIVQFFYFYVAHQIPEHYFFKKILVKVSIEKVVKRSVQTTRLIAKTQQICDNTACKKIYKRIELSLYRCYKKPQVGEQWQFYIKIKPWHGYANPGGFNSELWAFIHGIAAKGYVYTNKSMRRIATINPYSLVGIKNIIRDRIISFTSKGSDAQAIILALVLGDKSEMTYQLRQLLQITGTSHLLAISGLHIGLISGGAYLLLYWLWRLSTYLCRWIPAKKAAGIFALIIAFLYALISGMGSPAIRALLMIAILTYALCKHQRINTTIVFYNAFLFSIIIQPFSLLNISFWLSYLAIFLILYVISYRYQLSKIISYWKIQWAITVGLMPILFFYFHQSASIGMITNLFAIPMVSFIILPLSFIASIFHIDLISHYIFNLDSQLINFLIWLLGFCKVHLFGMIYVATDNLMIVISAIIGCLLLLSPLQLRLNGFAIIFFLPLIFYQPRHIDENDFSVSIIDVGQGLSILVRTKFHNLVYDLGSIYPSGGSATQSAVLPLLLTQKISKIDKLIVSHQDSDHVGDINLFKHYYPNTEILTSAIKKLNYLPNIKACRAGEIWVWDGVVFKILAPESSPYIGDNHESCVLQISNQQHQILLTGDLASKDEKQLLKAYAKKLQAEVLVLSHHGSKYSSSKSFLSAINPKYAIVSAGFANRFHFPNQSVLQRCQSLGINVLRTDKCGMIDFYFPRHAALKLACYRYKRIKI